MPPHYRAFTSSYPAIASSLINEVDISIGFDPQANPITPPRHRYRAIWDTGATNTVITQAVIATANLQPTGMIMVNTVNGIRPSNTYLVNVILPNSVEFTHVKVTEGTVTGADILIGMDIIAAGDFAVTNQGGKTVFSYRHPSIQCIDFVKDIRHAGMKKVRVKKRRH